MNADLIPDAINWHDGLLLTPQHFQQLTLRSEALVQYGTALCLPFCWGLRRFKHDPIVLPGGKLRVVELEAVMPDGLVVWQDTAEAEDALEVDLTKHSEHMRDRPLPIYLAVVASDRVSSGNEPGRYEQVKGRQTDGALQPREIYRLKPRLKLLATESLPAKYYGFPIARVQHNDSFAFDEEFIPPVLSVSTQSSTGEELVPAAVRLADMCAETAERIRKRAMFLANEDPARANGGGRSEMMTRQQMHGLVACLPSFEALLRIRVAHPLSLYLGLCAIAGQVAVLGKENIPPQFKAYDHNDLFASFKPLLDFIDRSLDRGIPVSYKSYKFHNQDRTFQLHFDGSWTKKRLAIGIKGQAGMTPDELVQWGRNCRIGSQDEIEGIRENRIRGAGREQAERVGDVVPAKGVVLFALDADREFIKSDQLLHIFNDGTQPVEIVLYVLED